jgi:peptidoglycan/xylan/chitin deacetylase (PgdA/CDA1 family)
MSPAHTVAVLGYHKVGQPSPGTWENWYYVPEATFKEQLRVLDEGGWEALDVPAFVRGIADPRTLPSRAAVVTFDDAYRSLIACALPCMQGRPGAVFVPTDFVGQMNGFDANTDQPPERICDWKDLKALQDAGVSVQSHSASHPEFSALSERLLDAELSRSKHVLEEGLESPVQLLAYPYGDAGRDSHAVGEALRRRGYVAAFLYGGGPVTLPAPDPFRIDRIAMGPDTDLEAELAAAGLAAG